MSLLVVICNPINMSISIYEKGYHDDEPHYSEFLFQQITLLFFNLATTCFLTVLMFFTSISLKHIKVFQEDVIAAIDGDMLTCSKYISIKEKIVDVRSEFYLLIQILMITAGVNIIAFVMEATVYYNYYTEIGYTYKDLIRSLVHMIPYLLKEIVFFFYILLIVASVNTNSNNLLYKLNTKCWKLKKEDKSVILNDYVVMHLDAQSYPIEFKLGPIEVRRERILLTLATLVAYSLYILIRIRKAY